MTNQFRWDGTPLSPFLLNAVASELKFQNVLPGTPRFHFTIHAVIIKYFLGDDWFRDHLLPDSHPNSFLRPDFSSADIDPTYSIRTLELAEMLLNLQSVQGFWRCLEHLSLRQIQSGLAELQIGQVLKIRGIPFRYVEDGDTTTVDIIFHPFAETTAFAEIKCKGEDTPYSDATLSNALTKARLQIGKGNAGVVFVKVPTAWVEVSQRHPSERPNIRLPRSVLAAAERAMRASSRIKKIIFYVVHYAYDPTWGLSSTQVTMEISNPANIDPWVEDLLRHDMSNQWVRMPELHDRWKQ